MSDGIVMADDESAVTEEQKTHDQKMADKFENQNQSTDNNTDGDDNQVAQRPDNVPEKFWDAEKGELKVDDVLKSYTEMEKKMSQTDDKSADDNADNNNDDSTDDKDGDNETQSLDYDKYTDEFMDAGDLSPESYAELEKAGISGEMVRDYIDGQLAITQLRETLAFTEAGSEQDFRSMQEWAKTNLTDAEIKAFDEAVTGKQDAMVSAVRDLKAKYVEANGSEGTLLNGDKTATTSGYESISQMKADMADKRYKTDPAFRNEVQLKLSRSNIM